MQWDWPPRLLRGLVNNQRWRKKISKCDLYTRMRAGRTASGAAGFRRHWSEPVERVIVLINPVLRWANYVAVRHSSESFSFIKDWVEQNVRLGARPLWPSPADGIVTVTVAQLFGGCRSTPGIRRRWADHWDSNRS